MDKHFSCCSKMRKLFSPSLHDEEIYFYFIAREQEQTEISSNDPCFCFAGEALAKLFASRGFALDAS